MITTICATILLKTVPGKDAMAKEAKNNPAIDFPKSNTKEILQSITAIILKKLEAKDRYSLNWFWKYLTNLLILKFKKFMWYKKNSIWKHKYNWRIFNRFSSFNT